MKQSSVLRFSGLVVLSLMFMFTAGQLKGKCPESCPYYDLVAYMVLPEKDCNKDWDNTWAYGTISTPSEFGTTGMLDNGYARFGTIDVEVQEFDPVLGWVTIFGVKDTALACIDIGRALKCTDYRFRWRKTSSSGGTKCPSSLICFVYKSDPNNYCN